MKKMIAAAFVNILLFSALHVAAQKKEPWTTNQLMAPSDLAAMLNNTKATQPLIYCIGPTSIIKGSVDVGQGREKSTIDKLQTLVSKLPKNANIVLYCGCCPFENCPNIRPAFELLNKMKFTNHKLLNLEHNIKIDWINKGYPRN